MKRVVCINDRKQPEGGELVEGREYEVEREFINNFDQKTFVKLMKTSSLGIINSGNLKYEFAAIGKPFILISNDKNSVSFCKTFSDFFYCKFFEEFKVPSTKFFNNYNLLLSTCEA